MQDRVGKRENDNYSLPGGGHNHGEPWMCTAVREVKEELNLDVRTAERLQTFDFDSAHSAHKVSLLTTDQEPVVNSKEILEFIWWHPDSSLAVAPSVPTLWERIIAAGLIAPGDVSDLI